MRPARTTTKKSTVSSSKPNNTTSAQGRRDQGAVVSKFIFPFRPRCVLSCQTSRSHCRPKSPFMMAALQILSSAQATLNQSIVY